MNRTWAEFVSENGRVKDVRKTLRLCLIRGDQKSYELEQQPVAADRGSAIAFKLESAVRVSFFTAKPQSPQRDAKLYLCVQEDISFPAGAGIRLAARCAPKVSSIECRQPVLI
jgi:hypothetical protein